MKGSAIIFIISKGSGGRTVWQTLHSNRALVRSLSAVTVEKVRRVCRTETWRWRRIRSASQSRKQ